MPTNSLSPFCGARGGTQDFVHATYHFLGNFDTTLLLLELPYTYRVSFVRVVLGIKPRNSLPLNSTASLAPFGFEFGIGSH